MRLSWRAVRCTAGRGAVFVGEAPGSQVAALEAAKPRHVQGLDCGGTLLENGQRVRVRLLRLNGEGWVREMTAPGGEGGKRGQTPMVLVLMLSGEEAARAVETLGRARNDPLMFIAAMGVGASEEQRLRAAVSSAESGVAGMVRALCAGEPPAGRLTVPPGVLI